ncbi:ABC transporter substrate-binding protein [Acetobacter sp. AN02]|uniref:ABC transporter substrate-binding protein n=1 Tax=Acetobacter sp. AN02 TaxID=2894186 RepID=UPI0024344AFE|nr:ABC transporter substrate-binding protein [Acetobacter sp. AN02]MDG6095290.1 ABC transporter substrate-binding protein [Acetobacter sp. AN02]
MTDSDKPQGHDYRRRRILIAGAAGAAVSAAGGLLYLRSGHHHHTGREPDGRFRRITLAWPDPASDPVALVARAKGFYARYSLEVTLLPGTGNGAAAISAMNASADCLGAVAPVLTWLPSLYGGPVDARLTGGLSSGTYRLLARNSAHITRIEDIPGRKIAVISEESADRRFLSVLLRRKGINPDGGVQWVYLPPDQAPDALLAGQADALVAHDPFAWTVLAAHRSEMTELTGSDTGNYSSRINHALGLKAGFLRNDPDGALALVLALRDSCVWIEKNTDQIPALLSQSLPDTDDQILEEMIRHQALPHHSFGNSFRDQVAQYADELKLIGVLPEEMHSGEIASRFCQNVFRN